MEGGTTEAILEKRHHPRQSFIREFSAESKTLWKLSGPAIFTYICLYSLGALTQTFSGQVGELELVAVSVENSVTSGLVFGAMVGLSSKYEESAEKVNVASLPRASRFALWMIPQMFAYAFSIQKFLQSQRKLMRLLNASWWLIVILQLVYIFYTKSDGGWSGFSCLKFWYLMIFIVLAGHLDNPVVPVDALSICMNINRWDAMISIGFNAAIRIANLELSSDWKVLPSYADEHEDFSNYLLSNYLCKLLLYASFFLYAGQFWGSRTP